MGRFRMCAEEEDYPAETNYFDAKHVYSSSDDDADNDDPRGFWDKALVPVTVLRPQEVETEEDAEQVDEHSLGSSPIFPPFVTIRRNNNDEIAVQEEDGAHQYEQPSKPRFPWFRIFLFALLAHIVAAYGPASPPPDVGSDSWEDFWVTQLRLLWRSASLILYVSKYSISWISAAVYDDAQATYHQIRTHQEEKARLALWSNCTLTIPEEWNLEVEPSSKRRVNGQKQHQNSSSDDFYPIFGQPWAVKDTTKALDAWAQSAPLLLYFAGSEGVGKLELAKQISLRMFGHCLDDAEDDFSFEDLANKKSGPVMMLQGLDFAIHHESNQDTTKESGEESGIDNYGKTASQKIRAIRVQMYERIIRHAQGHPGGSVIVVQHAEDMADGFMATMVQDLTNPSRHFTDGTTMGGHDTLVSRLQLACQKTVFIMTSSVGSKTVSNSIYENGGRAYVPRLELDLILMHIIDVEFGAISTSTLYGVEPRRKLMNIASQFHAVAPFFPLEFPTLSQILTLKIFQWSQEQSTKVPPLRASERLVDALLDDSHIEYKTIMSGTTTIFTFSGAGAQFMREGNPWMSDWQASVWRCFWKKNNFWYEEEDNNPQDEGMIAVLDCKKRVRQAMVMMCPEAAVVGPKQDVLSHPVVIADRAACSEACRFEL
ncbi:expressed unknown protein [Seminavis robusta]|uniref:Uncharacterized protein n=1 Tax=Seminavis robusta TaxID=568900 RepID=A0A9N8HCP0_9STRA|nr:expressed unknown protein [Seminavis robusta]|eukprot:Sro390_g132780.1 n/a (655) ;mRNA; r:17156-19225